MKPESPAEKQALPAPTKPTAAPAPERHGVKETTIQHDELHTETEEDTPNQKRSSQPNMQQTADDGKSARVEG
jgi:hypothetical protein